MATSSLDDDLFDTVAADFLARFRSGEHPSVEDYTARHPELADEIRELFPTMLAIERIKHQKEHSSDGRASLGARKLERLGDFRIIREIGRGGMGVVFEAEQESLQRHVALKVLPPNVLQDDSHVRRFHREAQTAARLHHTNIVPVFGVGEDEGLHYYVMQLIDGEPLDRQLQPGRRQPLDPSHAADLVRQIAEAVQFAHDQGTLHRDIKPANLLLDRSGNVWITDFGLAQVLEREDTLTDHVAGTLRYMAPERFHGTADARSDQYSLGITLYELLSGVRAFEGSASGELMHRIAHSEPTPLRNIAPRVPRDLQTIVERAISKDASHRYPSVGDLAEDLSRFLDGRPILARPLSPLGRLWRWRRRNRALAASLAAVAALLIIVAGMLVVGYVNTRRYNVELEGLLAAKAAALQNESTALDNERDAREQERRARQAAEAITQLAIAGLDRVFEEFAPAAPYTVALPLAREVDEDDEPLLLPAQATVSPQVAAALERLLPLYRELADETAQDGPIRLRAASAQHRLGLIYRQLGRQDAARSALWAARALLEALQQDQVISSTELRLLLARVLNDLGDLDRQSMHHGRERWEAHQQALALLAAPSLDSLSREERLELARTHYFLGHRDGAFRFSRRSAPDRNERNENDQPAERNAAATRIASSPRPPSPRESDRARAGDEAPEAERGRSTPSRGDPFAIRRQGRQHLSTAIQLLEDFPHAQRDTRVRLLLARCYREQLWIRDWDDRDGRNSDWDTAVRLLEELVRESPETPDFRFELSETFADIEPRRMPDDRLAEAESRLRDALELSVPLVQEAPEVPAYAAGQTQILVKLGHVLRRAGTTDEARQRLTEAIALQDGLAKRFPETLFHHVWVVRITRSLAEILLAEDRFDEAIAVLEEAAARIEPLLAQPDSQRSEASAFFAAFTLADTYATLADIYDDQGDADAAEECRNKAQRFRSRPRGRPQRPAGDESTEP